MERGRGWVIWGGCNLNCRLCYVLSRCALILSQYLSALSLSFHCLQGLISHNIWVSNKIKDILCYHYQHSAVWTYFITPVFFSLRLLYACCGSVSGVFPVNYGHVCCVSEWLIACLHVNTGIFLWKSLSAIVCRGNDAVPTCDLIFHNCVIFLLSPLSCISTFPFVDF